jgi:hypothetical protein
MKTINYEIAVDADPEISNKIYDKLTNGLSDLCEEMEAEHETTCEIAGTSMNDAD